MMSLPAPLKPRHYGACQMFYHHCCYYYWIITKFDVFDTRQMFYHHCCYYYWIITKFDVFDNKSDNNNNLPVSSGHPKGNWINPQYHVGCHWERCAVAGRTKNNSWYYHAGLAFSYGTAMLALCVAKARSQIRSLKQHKKWPEIRHMTSNTLGFCIHCCTDILKTFKHNHCTQDENSVS